MFYARVGAQESDSTHSGTHYIINMLMLFRAPRHRHEHSKNWQLVDNDKSGYVVNANKQGKATYCWPYNPACGQAELQSPGIPDRLLSATQMRSYLTIRSVGTRQIYSTLN